MSEATGAAPDAGELADRLARLRGRLDEFRGRL
jgi:hypothetical protein